MNRLLITFSTPKNEKVDNTKLKDVNLLKTKIHLCHIYLYSQWIFLKLIVWSSYFIESPGPPRPCLGVPGPPRERFGLF